MQFSTARDEWMVAHPQPWDESTECEYYEEFDDELQAWLDEGAGACFMRDPRIREIVESALRHFDGLRYSLYAYVVMPNHVHVLFMPHEGFSISQILQSWKSFTSKQINQALRRNGVVWQKESWDRLVRNITHFNSTRDYIVRNDRKLAFDAYRQSVQ